VCKFIINFLESFTLPEFPEAVFYQNSTHMLRTIILANAIVYMFLCFRKCLPEYAKMRAVSVLRKRQAIRIDKL
jgi:hypothetical protein